MITNAELKQIFDSQDVCLLEYLRKSRADNENESVEQVLAKHEGILKDYLKNTFGIEIPESDIYREVISGETIDEREEMKRMLDRVEQGNVFAVVVVEPQRLTRGDLVDLGTVERVFRYTNTLIICPNKIYDLTDQFDLKLLRMELQQGSEYLEYMKMILARGRMRSIEEGKFVTGVAPTGYDRVKLDRGYSLKPNSEAEAIKGAFKLYAENPNINQTATWLSEQLGRNVHKFVCKRILKNKAYAGFITYGRLKNVKTVENGKVVIKQKQSDDYMQVKGIHEPLVSIELFERVQKLLSINEPKVPESWTLQNSLSGLIYCAKCGKPLQRRRSSVGKYSLACPNKNCSCVSAPADIIEDRVFTAIAEELKKDNRYLADYEQEIVKETASREKEISRLEKSIAKLENKLSRIMDAYEDGTYDKATYINRSNSIKDELEPLKAKIISLHSEDGTSEVEVIKKRIPNLEKCLKAYSKLNPKERNDLLKTIISRISYEKNIKGHTRSGKGADNFVLEITFAE